MYKPVEDALDQVGSVLLGKRQQVRLALCGLIAGGHLLLEDLPGMGKTTLAHALADVLGLTYGRVQFTSDLMPADVLGMSVFNRNTSEFEFRPGPVFNQVLLADEINRATPRTQSALLEAMAERQVSVDGVTRELPAPFFVIATQNPTFQSGTYPLPESQLDRFLMRLRLGYPDPAAEKALLLTGGQGARKQLARCISESQLVELQQQVDQIKLSESLLGYVQRLIAFSRNAKECAMGLSPRAALALVRTARAWALIQGRDYVIPEDVQTLLGPVAAHRLVPSAEYSGDGDALVALMLANVDVVAD